MSNQFEYNEAFSRNIGLLTPEEQEKLRTFTIAIPGMGGVGGSHLISLVRQGFEKFKIADLDQYELKNFNRQYGARLDTIDRPKVEVMKEEALKINPHCQIEVYPEGISVENIDGFLSNVDLSIDAIDAFSPDVRRMFINESVSRNIPAVSAGPIGFGTAFMIFMPGGATFDEHFSMHDGMSFQDKMINFVVGLVPKMLQRSYMNRTNIEEKRGPSSIGSINLCAGIVDIYAIKILLKKGSVKAIPYYHQFDVMKERYVSKRLWWGNKNPLQRIKILLASHLVKD
ncbi:ThiF family adenylyltransferase [Candidatus Nomurabacteria bacterium]|nr:ThiF family adenylyltransferase [Candidatus Kaiserbacteria bacterium]MCB9815237.1 ThiF family adenylyltransferase [Candidatus Nomurabacteria bacterium]